MVKAQQWEYSGGSKLSNIFLGNPYIFWGKQLMLGPCLRIKKSWEHTLWIVSRIGFV